MKIAEIIPNYFVNCWKWMGILILLGSVFIALAELFTPSYMVGVIYGLLILPFLQNLAKAIFLKDQVGQNTYFSIAIFGMGKFALLLGGLYFLMKTNADHFLLFLVGPIMVMVAMLIGWFKFKKIISEA